MFDPENPDNERSIKVKQLREKAELAGVRKAAARADLAIAEATAKRAKEIYEKADQEESFAIRQLVRCVEEGR